MTRDLLWDNEFGSDEFLRIRKASKEIQTVIQIVFGIHPPLLIKSSLAVKNVPAPYHVGNCLAIGVKSGIAPQMLEGQPP